MPQVNGNPPARRVTGPVETQLSSYDDTVCSLQAMLDRDVESIDARGTCAGSRCSAASGLASPSSLPGLGGELELASQAVPLNVQGATST